MSREAGVAFNPRLRSGRWAPAASPGCRSGSTRTPWRQLGARRYAHSMFDHVAIHVADLATSERFYRTVLPTLGIEPTHVADGRIEWNDLHLVAASAVNPPTRHLHVGFLAPSRERVDEFWRAGTDAGYQDDGPPGERPHYTPSYYGAFLRDPDGNSAEAVRQEFVRGGGHIDHLWIRVRDLDAARASTQRPCATPACARAVAGRRAASSAAPRRRSRSSPTAPRSPSVSRSPSLPPIARWSTISTGTQSRSVAGTPARPVSGSGRGRAATRPRCSISTGRGLSVRSTSLSYAGAAPPRVLIASSLGSWLASTVARRTR
jgi:catechol 2,3-dioxygenase-like lactoylglutathione lyase family enzyme